MIKLVEIQNYINRKLFRKFLRLLMISTEKDDIIKRFSMSEKNNITAKKEKKRFENFFITQHKNHPSFCGHELFISIIIDKKIQLWEYDGPSEIVLCLLGVDCKNLSKNQKNRNNLDKPLKQFSCMAFILFWNAMNDVLSLLGNIRCGTCEMRHEKTN